MGIFRLWLNGQQVGNDWFAPGDSQYRETMCYLKYDVTDLLRAGRNALGAELAGGWYTGYVTFSPGNFNFFGDQEALLARLAVVYEDGRPVAIDTVVISHQTTAKGATKAHYAEIKRLAKEYLAKTGLLAPKTKFYINPTGKFVIGGPCGDSGLTGRKIIVDTYGGMAAHGGGAFSGKDASKVDRSAAYYARYAAKNIVAAGLADRCQIQVAYAIGVDRPVSFCVKTFGTAHGVTNESLEKMLASGEIFDFRPYKLINSLGLLKPKGWKYEDTAAYGHFGRPEFPWEKLDKTAALMKWAKR